MKDEIKEIFELYENQAIDKNLASLIKTLKEWYFEKEDYKSRIDKAVEYIENDLKSFLYSIEYKTLLNILNGGDKE